MRPRGCSPWRFIAWRRLVADGVKFAQKEAVTPAAADGAVFRLAPFVSLVPYLAAMAAIPNTQLRRGRGPRARRAPTIPRTPNPKIPASLKPRGTYKTSLVSVREPGNRT